MSDRYARNAEDAVIGLGNKNARVGVVVGDGATTNEDIGPGDIWRITTVNVVLHLRARTAARFRIKRMAIDVRGGGTPEFIVHLVTARRAVHVRDIAALVVVAGIGVSAARAILAINVVISELARKAVTVPEPVRIGIACVMAIHGSYATHGDVVRRFIAFDASRKIVTVLT